MTVMNTLQYFFASIPKQIRIVLDCFSNIPSSGIFKRWFYDPDKKIRNDKYKYLFTENIEICRLLVLDTLILRVITSVLLENDKKLEDFLSY